MSTGGPTEITLLLKAWGAGDHNALNRLTPLVYDELRRMARRYMRKERAGNTLQTTALINEAYLRLVDAQSAGCRIERISSRSRRSSCGGFWWTRREPAARPSAAALPFAWIIPPPSIWTRYRRSAGAPNWFRSMTP